MILISPYSSRLKSGNRNAKNYPYWNELIVLIKTKYPDIKIIQVGIEGEELLNGVDEYLFNRHLNVLADYIRQCDTWISVDNFFHHWAIYNGKPGIVIWGQSDPNIFGFPQNTNILKNRVYLRHDQFRWWEDAKYVEDAFVKPEVVLSKILT